MENPRTGSKVGIYSDQMLAHVFKKKNVEPRHECPPHRYLIYSESLKRLELRC